jgi:hypothetical protein
MFYFEVLSAFLGALFLLKIIADFLQKSVD